MKAWNYLEELCALPPRGSTSVGEQKAAEWLQQRLSEWGYRVERQRFRSPNHTLYHGPLLVIAILLVSTLLLARWPALAAAVGVLSLLPLVGEMLGLRKLNFDVLLPKRESQNVVAHAPDGVAKGDKPKLVVVAHYDTQWGSYLFAPGFRSFVRPFFVVTYAGLALAVVGLLLRWALPNSGAAGVVLGISTAILAVAGAFLTVSRITGRVVPGANDNGSGVAVALALADRWRKEGPAEFEPVFLFTGCEEVGLRGMHHYLATANPRPGTTFINLDNVGGGRLRYLLGEGMLTYQPYDPHLIGLAERLAKETGDKVRPLRNLLLPTDGLLSAKAGYPTLTFLAAGDDNAILNYHWHSDTLENADRGLVEFTESFVWTFIQALAREREGGRLTNTQGA